MIFIGDVVSPTVSTSRDFLASVERWKHVFQGEDLLCNLEGMIAEDYCRTDRPMLSSHPSVFEALTAMNTKVVSLANNHILDLPDNLGTTIGTLKRHGISHCGAGVTIEEAEQAAHFVSEGFDIFVLACAWDVLMQHQRNEPGRTYVNPIRPDRMLNRIRALRKQHGKAKIIVAIHWNFDLEGIPFPMHRTYARAMIDAGANVIAGSHSHCVQGGERYRDGVIVYGLGNFFFPWHIFTTGKSYFPEWSRPELALQWSPATNEATCYWFTYKNSGAEHHEVVFEKLESFDSGKIISRYSLYRGMGEREYIRWYRENRRKRFAVPVYRTHKQKLRNKLFDAYLKKRIRFARFLAQKGLRSWKR